MPRRDDKLALQHMLDYTQSAMRTAAGHDRGDLEAVEMLRLALTRAVEVIGEAAARVSDAGRKRYPKIPWPQIKSARNRLIHGCDAINLDILWDIVELDLPPLVAQLQAGPQDESDKGS